MKSHFVIFNRAPAVTADGWIHIVPRGDLPNREAGIVQVLDAAALDSILAGIEADRRRLGDKWPGVYAGREHFIYNDEKDSEALAWFKDFEKRPDGIWAKDGGLTDIGREAIENRRYKFTSFVADRKNTLDLGNGRVRILKIDTVGFTNQANGRELLTPITNREITTFASAVAPADGQQTNQTNKMKSVCTLLGLSADADEASAHAAVTKLLNRCKELEPLAAEIETLKNRAAELEAEQCDAILDAHGIRADDKSREKLKPVLLTLKNRADRQAFLTDCITPARQMQPQRILTNRDTKPPGNAGAENERDLSSKILNRARELQTATKCPFDAAHQQAVREIQK